LLLLKWYWYANLTDYAKGNPSVSIKNVNGVADLVHGIIAQGKKM
jgi:hypothetical protein